MNGRSSGLEARIPPPAVMLATGVAQWGVSKLAPLLALSDNVRLTAAGVLVLIAVLFSVTGVASFRRARTTLNPTTLGAATSLVTSGIYRVTRNPMYVGLLFFLIAWAVFCDCAWALLGPVVFIAYINRFQIRPEERALAQIFGTQFDQYRSSVRRWL